MAKLPNGQLSMARFPVALLLSNRLGYLVFLNNVPPLAPGYQILTKQLEPYLKEFWCLWEARR